MLNAGNNDDGVLKEIRQEFEKEIKAKKEQILKLEKELARVGLEKVEDESFKGREQQLKDHLDQLRSEYRAEVAEL